MRVSLQLLGSVWLLACRSQVAAPIEPERHAQPRAPAPWSCGAFPDDHEIVLHEHGEHGRFVRELRVVCSELGMTAMQYEPSEEHEGFSDAAAVDVGTVELLWKQAHHVGTTACVERDASGAEASLVVRVGTERRSWACAPSAALQQLARALLSAATPAQHDLPGYEWPYGEW